MYKSQSNLPNRLLLYKTSFLIGYKSICEVYIYVIIELKGEKSEMERDFSIEDNQTSVGEQFERLLALVTRIFPTETPPPPPSLPQINITV